MADLITLAQAKSWLNIGTDQTGDDALIQTLVDAASDQFLLYTYRDSILPQTYVEQRNGCSGNSIVPYNTPIISVQSIAISGTVIPQSQNGLAGWWVDGDAIKMIGGGFCFPWGTGIPYSFQAGPGQIVLSYTAGCEVTPPSIVQCVMEMVGWTYKNKDRIGQVGQHFADSLTTSFNQAPMSASSLLTIQKYRRKGSAQW